MREHKTPIWKKITKFDSCEKKTLPNAKFLCMTENVRKWHCQKCLYVFDLVESGDKELIFIMTPMFVLISQQTPRPNPQIYQGAAIAMIVWSWIYNYLCNQCLSPLMLWVWISIRVRCTTSYDKVCQWLALGRWFPPPIKLTSTI